MYYFRNAEDIPEEIEGNSQSDVDDEDDDYDDDQDDDEDDDDEEDDDDDEDVDNEDDDEIDNVDKIDVEEQEMDNKMLDLSSSWLNDDDGADELISSEKCDCYHCASQAKAEQLVRHRY